MWPVETTALEMMFILLCQQSSGAMIKYKRVGGCGVGDGGGGGVCSLQLDWIALSAELLDGR